MEKLIKKSLPGHIGKKTFKKSTTDRWMNYGALLYEQAGKARNNSSAMALTGAKGIAVMLAITDTVDGYIEDLNPATHPELEQDDYYLGMLNTALAFRESLQGMLIFAPNKAYEDFYADTINSWYDEVKAQ